jgi:NAD(P)H dehydrogenase (quinone)
MNTNEKMTEVLIVYTSSFGNTKRMAEAVTDGAPSVEGTEVFCKEASEATADDVRVTDAIIMGSRVRHRTADARVKQFIEKVCEKLWLTDEMVSKVGGVFTVGGGYGDCGAGSELAQLGLLDAFAAAGMILVTQPKTTTGFQVAGTHWGPHNRSGGSQMEPVVPTR